MNFVGHIHLAALRTGPGAESDGYLVGAALPDIAAMGRFRLIKRSTAATVAAGVDFHHQTDDAFHRHGWFRTYSTSVSTELEAGPLTRGAARAVGHVGVELLLDGHLLDTRPDLRHQVQQALSSVSGSGSSRSRSSRSGSLGLADLVEPERRGDWADHLDSVSAWTLPADYRQPAAVAERLRRILARRPRLAFDRGQVEVVADVLARHQVELEAGVDRLISELDERLRG